MVPACAFRPKPNETSRPGPGPSLQELRPAAEPDLDLVGNTSPLNTIGERATGPIGDTIGNTIGNSLANNRNMLNTYKMNDNIHIC